jgi:hypothetical protein
MLAVLIAVDARIKHAPFPGFVPENSSWVAASRDLPQLWERAGAAECMAASRDDLRAELNDLTLAVYKLSGIRPTPLRWRAWLGNSFVGAVSGEDAGICVKPGLLLRARLALARHPRLQDGAYVFGNYYYAWREGFLIAGTSSAFVKDALRAAPLELENLNGPGLTIELRRDPRFLVKLEPRESLMVTGYLSADISKRQGPLELAALGDNLAVADASTPQDLIALLSPVGKLAQFAFPRLEKAVGKTLVPVFDRWRIPPLPKNYARGITETSAFLADLKIDHSLPVPCGGLIMRGNGQYATHPLDALAGQHALPYEWRGTPGRIVPWLGEEASLCLARWNKDWLVTTQEQLMAKIIGEYPRETVPADAFLAVDLERAAKRAGTLLQKAGDMELIPWMNGQDAVNAYGARLKALGDLGRLQLVFNRDTEGRINFKGDCLRK